MLVLRPGAGLGAKKSQGESNAAGEQAGVSQHKLHTRWWHASETTTAWNPYEFRGFSNGGGHNPYGKIRIMTTTSQNPINSHGFRSQQLEIPSGGGHEIRAANRGSSAFFGGRGGDGAAVRETVQVTEQPPPTRRNPLRESGPEKPHNQKK